MAKYEKRFTGEYFQVLEQLDQAILNGSASASRTDESRLDLGGVLCTVRVYERYSFTGGNRVSLPLTLLGDEDQLVLSAITAGGSQAMFFKLNTLGEEAFLDTIRETLDRL